MKLKRPFYLLPTLQVAKKLLGKFLVYKTEKGILSGEINEVEAYIGSADPACHASRGKTKRNSVMFERGGIAYIYFTYGMYYCLNVVTEHTGFPSAILIRSVIPTEGVEIMKDNRVCKRNGLKVPTDRISKTSLTNGPGKLCQAYGLTTKQNGTDLVTSKDLFIEDRNKRIHKFHKTPRIGIRVGTEKLWRFHYS